ncbi:MAG: sulfite exporter TauE/SafE family protein [Gammaproteobacteria bacterium]
MEFLLIYLMLGLVAGFLAGLLGVGGGLVMVPVLAWTFALQGMAPGLWMHLALGTSLAVIVFTSISSVRAHYQHGAVRTAIFARMAPSILLGALAGAVTARYVAQDALRWFFAFFELAVAIQMAWAIKPKAHATEPGWPRSSAAGTVIGAVSSWVGIGGGTLTVPWLVWHGIRMQEAVATSAAVGMPIAIAGAAGYMLGGWGHADLPAQSWGFVYLPAWGAIAVGSVLAAPFGARAAHALDAVKLKRIFALVLFVLAIKMFMGLEGG